MRELPSDRLKSLALSQLPTIVMSEGEDERIVSGAWTAHQQRLARIILVGDRQEVSRQIQAQGASLEDGFEIHDPSNSTQFRDMADAYFELRKHRGVTKETALDLVRSPLAYSAMLVKMGQADGTVGGAVATTADVVRAALQIIGKSPTSEIVSSFFMMYPAESATDQRIMLYSDCGLVIDPNASELASIALASAQSFGALTGEKPKLAMLSFSTKGSARHQNVTKVTEALDIIKSTQPYFDIDGELQFDAAFVPSVGASKAPGSAVAGHANVMIFPNLDAGNIAYKITQRLGGYLAIGPVLQGLNNPANDLSRGCDAEDVTQMIAVTALQIHASK